MSIYWLNRKLREVAEIRVSNVDKKTHSGELPVKLCNYMDVYSNEYVTSRIDFMEASATLAEIDRFGLKVGDVVITKDSETPDDIGISTIITEDIGGLVCGYHLALIRPKADEIDSIFLAKQIRTSRVARYFSLQASGSTRYGLPISAIENVEIPTPPKPEQSKIAEILSTVDRAIEQTEALIAKQQRIKTGLMQDLLTRGIDEQGNLRSEETHEFKDSLLGRTPVEWEIKPLSDVVDLQVGYAFKSSVFSEDGIRLMRGENVGTGISDWKDTRWLPNCIAGNFLDYILANGDLIIGMDRTFTKQGSKVTTLNEEDVPCLLVQRVGRFIPINIPDVFMRILIESPEYKRQLLIQQKGMDIPHLSKIEILTPLVKVPKKLSEMREIARYIEVFRSSIKTNSSHISKLRYLKTALMQDLLTGKVRVTPLLSDIT